MEYELWKAQCEESKRKTEEGKIRLSTWCALFYEGHDGGKLLHWLLLVFLQVPAPIWYGESGLLVCERDIFNAGHASATPRLANFYFWTSIFF
jgi:hypothetical protein